MHPYKLLDFCDSVQLTGAAKYQQDSAIHPLIQEKKWSSKLEWKKSNMIIPGHLSGSFHSSKWNVWKRCHIKVKLGTHDICVEVLDYPNCTAMEWRYTHILTPSRPSIPLR